MGSRSLRHSRLVPLDTMVQSGKKAHNHLRMGCRNHRIRLSAYDENHKL